MPFFSFSHHHVTSTGRMDSGRSSGNPLSLWPENNDPKFWREFWTVLNYIWVGPQNLAHAWKTLWRRAPLSEWRLVTIGVTAGQAFTPRKIKRGRLGLGPRTKIQDHTCFQKCLTTTAYTLTLSILGAVRLVQHFRPRCFSKQSGSLLESFCCGRFQLLLTLTPAPISHAGKTTTPPPGWMAFPASHPGCWNPPHPNEMITRRWREPPRPLRWISVSQSN